MIYWVIIVVTVCWSCRILVSLYTGTVQIWNYQSQVSSHASSCVNFSLTCITTTTLSKFQMLYESWVISLLMIRHWWKCELQFSAPSQQTSRKCMSCYFQFHFLCNMIVFLEVHYHFFDSTDCGEELSSLRVTRYIYHNFLASISPRRGFNSIYVWFFQSDPPSLSPAKKILLLDQMITSFEYTTTQQMKR